MTETTTPNSLPRGTQCSVLMYDRGWAGRCHVPAKGFLENGEPGCGRHLAGERRSSARREREAADRLAEQARRSSLDADARSLGLEDSQYQTVFGGLPGRDRVLVSLDVLRNLLNDAWQAGYTAGAMDEFKGKPEATSSPYLKES